VKVKTLKSFLFRGCRCDQSPYLAVDNGSGTKPKVITKKDNKVKEMRRTHRRKV